MVGLGYSYPHSTVIPVQPNPTHNSQYEEIPWILQKTEHEYLNIERIKWNKDFDFCIVTLEKSVTNTSPLCLPKDPSINEYSTKGKTLGFGYTKEFPNEVKEINDVHLMKQRKMHQFQFEVSRCMQEYVYCNYCK